jgi:archaemetzincin
MAKKILLVPFEDVDENVLEKIRDYLSKTFGKDVISGEGSSLSPMAYNSSRKQYHSTVLLDGLIFRKSKEYERVLGIADADLYVPQLNFVFGEADPSQGIAIISITRLRQEFYGRSKDEALFIERAIKEAVHELGHTYGLGHCPDVKCVMHFSNSLRDTDIKGKDFCPKCIRRIRIP